MTKPIEVKFTKAHFDWLSNELHMMHDVNKALKNAGVPVVGWSCIKGVEHGRLELSRDGDDFVYRWHPEPAKVKKYDPLNDDEDESL